MSRKKTSGSVFRLAELAADLNFTPPASIPGFSISLQIPEVNFDKLTAYFRSDFVAILLVTDGEIVLTINFKKYTARKNDLLIISPSTIKQLVSIKKGSRFCAFVFTTEFVSTTGMPGKAREMADYYSSQLSPLWKLNRKDAAFILSMARQLERRIRNSEAPFGKELLQHQFCLFVYEMAKLSAIYAQPASLRLSRKENLLLDFTRLVQQQFRTQRSVQQYARQLNLTPKYLTETIKELSGRTAGEIIDEHVLLEAKLYLHNPEYSISQIAEALNFSDQSFFGKFFKRFTGLSPKAYRQAWQQDS